MPDIIIHTDSKTEKAVISLYSSYGFTVSDAVNKIFKKCIKEKELPIKAKKTRQFNAETLEALRETDEIIKNLQLYKSYNNVDDLMTALLNEEDNKI